MIIRKRWLLIALALLMLLAPSTSAAEGQVFTEFTATPVGLISFSAPPPTVTGSVVHFPHTAVVRVESDNSMVAGIWTNHADPCLRQPDKGALGPCHGISHIESLYGGAWDGKYEVAKHVRPFDPRFVDQPWNRGIFHGSGAFEGMTMQLEAYFLPDGSGKEIYRGRIIGVPR